MAFIFAGQVFIMKKLIIAVLAVISISPVLAQKTKKDWSKVDLDAAGDHLMIQISKDGWTGVPDTLSGRMKGFSRGLNIAFMLDKKFKTDPRWSVAFGVGASSSHIFFKSTSVDIATTGTTVLPFTNLDSSNHYKKYKLATTFVEIPVELRYCFHPENEKKSWKIAIGAKVGTLLNAHTKGKTLQNKYNQTLNPYTEKINKKIFFNNTRVAATARVGIGNFSLFGSYQVSTLLKDGAGPDIHPYQIGLCLSGL